MQKRTKRALKVFAIWSVLMEVIYFLQDFLDFWWILGSALVCLILASVLFVIWERWELFSKRPVRLAEEERRFNGSEAFEEGMENYQGSNFERALAYFNTAVECGYEDNVYEFRAGCLEKLGAHEKALSDYDKAISKRPEDSNLYFSRSFSRSSIGDNDCAISDLERAIELSRVDSELNEIYMAGAKEIGWQSHTALYESHLEMAKLKKQPNT